MNNSLIAFDDSAFASLWFLSPRPSAVKTQEKNVARKCRSRDANKAIKVKSTFHLSYV